MNAVKSLHVVVDTTVARAAGLTDHPISSACREQLDRIRRICHKVLYSKAIGDEWRKHEGAYFRTWLRSMYSKKKVINSGSASTHIQVSSITELTEKEREALEKDLHLIEAACQGNGIIVTLDKRIEEIWEKLPQKVRTARPITWIDPLKDPL